MKKTVAVLTILILTATVSGCVRHGSQNPESELPLDVAQMIETGTGKTGADPAMTAPGTDLHARLGAPAHYETEIVSEAGFLKVHTDADVVFETTNATPSSAVNSTPARTVTDAVPVAVLLSSCHTVALSAVFVLTAHAILFDVPNLFGNKLTR